MPNPTTKWCCFLNFLSLQIYFPRTCAAGYNETLYSEELGDKELDMIVEELRKRNLITIKQGKVSYTLLG